MARGAWRRWSTVNWRRVPDLSLRMNTPAKRSQLSAEELHQLRWALGNGLVLLSVWTVFYMEVQAWFWMALTTLASGATFLRPTLPARLPRLAHTLAFPIIVFCFTIDLWLFTELLPAMVRLCIMLLLYRGICYRARRDDLQIIVLGLFLIVVAGVITVSLLFAAQILVYTACALAFLFVVTISEGGVGTKPAPVVRDAVPAWAHHVSWRALARRLREVGDWRVAVLGLVLFAGVVAVSALLFLAIPRFQLQNSMFMERFISKKAKSGFSESIRFGDVTAIQQDDSVALSVDVSDPTQIPATPYWRMLVLDHYDNGTFKLSDVQRQRFRGERMAAYLYGTRPRDPAATQWTFYLESGISRYLPVLGHFEQIQFREPQNFRQSIDLVLVQLREEPVSMTAYRAIGFELAPQIADPDFGKRLADLREQGTALRLTTLRRSGLTQADNATLARVAREAAGENPGDATTFSQRVNAWLSANHSYSLDPKIPDGPGDPLVRWVASREAGHCELFAGSFVLLARTAGFNARVVTGFKGGTWNGYSNNFTIRNVDAHAWAEIYDEPSGAWLRADPLGVSAGADADKEAKGAAALAARTDRSWSARLDSLRVFWYRRIVNFDQRSQLETLKSVKEATERTSKQLREALTEWLGAVRTWAISPWDAARVTRVISVVSGLVLLGWLWRRFLRPWWRQFVSRRGGRREDPLRREAGQWLRRMAEGGVRTAESDASVVGDLQRVRYGARATWPQPDAVFRRARKALRNRSS